MAKGENDVEVVGKFTAQTLRPLADLIGAAYYASKKMLAEWDAGLIGERIAADDTPVEDGAGADGRLVLTGNDLHVLVNQAQALVDDFETGSGAKRNAVLKVAVNAQRVR